MSKKPKLKGTSMTATVVVIIVITLLCVGTYVQMSRVMKSRSIQRMEEGVNTAVTEINQKLSRDKLILEATADLIASANDTSAENINRIINAISPLMETIKTRVLMPDDTVHDPSGAVIDTMGSISFETEAALGSHVSNRMTSLVDGNTLVLRHFVPVVKNGETIALIYGTTILSELPNDLNIDNIYNASAKVLIIDNDNGDLIMDTWQGEFGNINDFKVRGTKEGDSWETSVKNISEGKSGHMAFMPMNSSQWCYMYYSPANINNWSLAVIVPESEAMKNLHAVSRIFLIFAVLMAVAIAVYYIFMRRSNKRITKQAVEQAVLEEKLQKAEVAERAKTMFLSNMSHDIRTPMNAIIGFATLAEANIDNKERIQEYLAKILSSGNHLLSLINDILDMSRIESGKLNIEETECNLSDIFKDMRNIMQTQMQSKQLNFYMDTLDVTDEEVYCDKLHVNQMLLNLLSNAIKFTPAGGTVSLTIAQKPDAPVGYASYEIHIKDTGIGMSEEFLKHVFEPFERERNSTVSGIQGTGLGMPIAKSIVDAMGGTIEVQSECGKGTEFIINLKLRLVSEPKKFGRIHELEGLRALVVDDSFTTCDSVAKMLMRIGMRSEWTLRGKEAVLRAKQAVEMGDEFYVYIIDWALPDLGGLEVARQIRAIVGDTVPIIILTAYDLNVVKDEMGDVNVTAMCNKPLFMSELRDTLISALGKGENSAEGEPVIPTLEDLKGKRLLLVEDNALNREIAEEILAESGFTVETAVDGSKAVDMVKNSEAGYYDAVLMDIQMPIMNGYEAARAIRALENKELANIPIVAMTANAFDDDREEAFKNGMNEHIAKPINVGKLTETLRQILK